MRDVNEVPLASLQIVDHVAWHIFSEILQSEIEMTLSQFKAALVNGQDCIIFFSKPIERDNKL